MTATHRFALAVNAPEPQVNLAEACLLIATHVYPNLDVTAELARFDVLASRCKPTFQGVCAFLFEESGFTGAQRYDDPRNSFLNEVLDSRRGIPITLSVVAMEVARRINVGISGIGMPAHFVIRDDANPDVYCDPFDGGKLLDAAGCRAKFHEIVGDDVPFDPNWLKPAGTYTILLRILANLKDLFEQRNQPQNVEWVTRARLSVPGCPPAQRRDLAHALSLQGRFVEAARELELTAGTVSDPDERHELMSEAVTMRAHLN